MFKVYFYTYIRSLVLPWGKNLYSGDHKTYNFGRVLPTQNDDAFIVHISGCREEDVFENLSNFGRFYLAPNVWGILKFSAFVTIVPKMLHTRKQKINEKARKMLIHQNTYKCIINIFYHEFLYVINSYLIFSCLIMCIFENIDEGIEYIYH